MTLTFARYVGLGLISDLLLRPFLESIAANSAGALSISVLAVVNFLIGACNTMLVPSLQAAVSALVEVFRHVGQHVRRDVAKLEIPPAKINLLNERFDEMQESGQMIASESAPSSASSTKSRAGTAKKPARGQSGARKSPSSGGMSREQFEEAMYNPGSPAYAGSESALEAEFVEMRKLLLDDKADWEKRMNKCKRMRCLVDGDALQLGNFKELVLESSSQLARGITDLRSQVCKETCLTVAKFSEVLGTKFEPVTKAILPALYGQSIINVKVIKESALHALNHVIRTCQAYRMMNLVDDVKTHKAVAMRRAGFGALLTLLHEWENDVVKKQVSMISEMLLVGMNDADSIVRQVARTGYWVFESSFPTAAATVMSRLDPSKVKILNKEKDIGTAAPPRKKPVAPRKVAPKKAASPEPRAVEDDRSRSPGRGSLNSSGPLRVKPSSSRTDTGMDGPSRVRPSSSTVKADLNRSGPQRVARAASSSARSTSVSSISSARRVVAKGPSRVAREPTVSEHIANAELLSRAGSAAERMEACSVINDLLSSGRVSDDDAANIAELTISQLAETNAKVIAAVADELLDFLAKFRDVTESLDWIRSWTAGLVGKRGMDLPSLVQEKVVYALDMLRGSFDAALQVIAVFEILANTRELQTVGAKIGLMEQLDKLLPDYDAEMFQSAYADNSVDFLSGIHKMAEFVTSKSADLRRLSTNNMLKLFQLDTQHATFAEMLSSWPAASLRVVRKALDVALPSWQAELDNRGNRLSAPSSSTMAFDLAVSMDDMGMGLDDDDDDMLMNEEDPSESLGYNPDMYQDLTPQSSPTHSVPYSSEPEHEPEHGKDRPDMRSSWPDEPEPEPFLSTPANGDVMSVPIDGPEEHRSEIEVAVESAISSYANGARDTPTMLAMLQIFWEASKEDDVVWDVHFDEVLEVILDLMDNESSSQVRDDSLRNLRQMLKLQTRYFANSTPMVVRKLLERHRETERDVLRSAEETLSVLSSTVPPADCALILKPIIWGEDGAVLLAAIKLMTKILKKLSPEQLRPLTDEITPGLIRGYKHPLAEVRKGVVFALVEMHLVLGDELNAHLGGLSSSQQKLLGIYIKRAEEKLKDISA